MGLSQNKNKYYRLFAFLFWIALWQFAALIAASPVLLPSPIETVEALFGLCRNGEFFLSIAATLGRVAAGLALSIVLGVALGAATSRFEAVGHMMEPFVSTMKSTPVMSVILLAIVWLRAGSVPIFVCVLLCFPIMYTNTLHGILAIDKQLLQMARIYSVRRRKVLRGIVLPSIKPHLYAGIMIIVGFSFKSVITAEVLSSPKTSMGYGLYETKLYLNTAELFAWTVVIVLLSMCLEKLVRNLFKDTERGS